MEYTEDELIDTIRHLDEEIEQLRAEVEQAEQAAVKKMRPQGYYNPTEEPGATVLDACPVCDTRPLTWQPSDAQRKRASVRFSIDPTGDNECDVIICDVNEDTRIVELELDEEAATWLGNIFIDIRNCYW